MLRLNFSVQHAKTFTDPGNVLARGLVWIELGIWMSRILAHQVHGRVYAAAIHERLRAIINQNPVRLLSIVSNATKEIVSNSIEL